MKQLFFALFLLGAQTLFAGDTIVSSKNYLNAYQVEGLSLLADQQRQGFNRKTIRRFYLVAYGSNNVISAAVTNPIGLLDDSSQKWNYGLKTGYAFWNAKRFRVSLETGLLMRDFGFHQNKSKIQYMSIPGMLRLQVGQSHKFIRANFYGGVEFNRLITSTYYYSGSDQANQQHNIHLHQNDAITAIYGTGLTFGRNRVQLEIFTERIIQVDQYDLLYGQTIGAITIGCSLHFLIF